MGIERFFSSIKDNKITNLNATYRDKLNKKLDMTHLYVDFNSIIYITSFSLITKLNQILYQIISKKTNPKFNKTCQELDIKFEEHPDLEQYTKLITDKFIIKSLIILIHDYIFNLLNTYINPDQLKLFYIALDGVPSKSKIMESKKRRYLGAMIDLIKHELFKKYEEELKENMNRYSYEKHKVNFNKTNISPGTKFMDKLTRSFYDEQFTNKIKKICPHLEVYTISGVYEPGEGEKKIVDYIKSIDFNIHDTHLLYSPDADIIPLSLLLHTNYTGNKQVKNITVLKQNPQDRDYDVINIDALADNMYNYVLNQVGNISKNSTIKDIVFLLTVFGNDFVPKIESCSVKSDFDNLINMYVILLKEQKEHMINLDGDMNKLNQKFFIRVIQELQQNEGGKLQQIYIQNNYQNYNQLKKLLNATPDNFIKVTQNFLNSIKSFNDDVKKLDTNKLISKWENQTDFIKILQRTTKLGLSYSSTPLDLITAYHEYYIRMKKLPMINFSFQRYKKTIENEYYSAKLNKILNNIDPDLKITEYDREVFKFDNMLDEYQKKLDAYTLNLGYIKLDTTRYILESEKISVGVSRYYSEFFKVSGDINIKNPKIKEIVENYIEGLMWVFEYYYNHFDINENRDNAYIWFYKYPKAPLLKQIYEYLQDSTINLNNIGSRVISKTVDMSKYFNCLEHFMYVSPAPVLFNQVPDVYRDFVKSGYYPDLEKAVKSIMTSDNAKIINCRGCIFLNKCELELIHTSEFSKDYDEIISVLRKIKLDKKLEKRTGLYVKNKPNIFIKKY
jgi:5'-3' exonuclease